MYCHFNIDINDTDDTDGKEIVDDNNDNLELQCNDKVEPAELKSLGRRGDRRVWDDSGQWPVDCI